MKTLSIILASLLSVPLMWGTTNAVTLGWCPSPSAGVSGYKLYYGIGVVTNWAPEIKQHTDPCDAGVIVSNGSNWFRAYTDFIDVGNTLAYTVTNLARGQTYFFSVMAYSSYGDEAPLSNEVMYQVPIDRPSVMAGLKVTGY